MLRKARVPPSLAEAMAKLAPACRRSKKRFYQSRRRHPPRTHLLTLGPCATALGSRVRSTPPHSRRATRFTRLAQIRAYEPAPSTHHEIASREINVGWKGGTRVSKSGEPGGTSQGGPRPLAQRLLDGIATVQVAAEILAPVAPVPARPSTAVPSSHPIAARAEQAPRSIDELVAQAADHLERSHQDRRDHALEWALNERRNQPRESPVRPRRRDGQR